MIMIITMENISTRVKGNIDYIRPPPPNYCPAINILNSILIIIQQFIRLVLNAIVRIATVYNFCIFIFSFYNYCGVFFFTVVECKHCHLHFQIFVLQVWLLVVALCTAISITVFLLESSAVFRVERNGQINNITIEMFGDNPKAFKMATTGMSLEMAVVELLSNTILTFDLILRFSISHQKKRFCRKPLNIIEFMIEILIFSFVSLEFLLDHEEAAKHTSYELSTLLQILYSLRVFRIFRLIESCSETKMLKISLLKSKTEFLLFVTVLISFAFIFGSWIYWAELLNPQTFPTIFTGIWWAIVTMTTVGYGDFTPKSTLGYFVGVLTSIFGLILLAMPIATIASNFSKIYDCYNFRKSHLKAKRAKQSNQLFYHRKAAMVLQGLSF